MSLFYRLKALAFKDKVDYKTDIENVPTVDVTKFAGKLKGLTIDTLQKTLDYLDGLNVATTNNSFNYTFPFKLYVPEFTTYPQIVQVSDQGTPVLFPFVIT